MGTLWKFVMDPDEVNKDNICDVFVQRSKYVKGRYFDGVLVIFMAPRSSVLLMTYRHP